MLTDFEEYYDHAKDPYEFGRTWPQLQTRTSIRCKKWLEKGSALAKYPEEEFQEAEECKTSRKEPRWPSDKKPRRKVHFCTVLLHGFTNFNHKMNYHRLRTQDYMDESDKKGSFQKKNEKNHDNHI